MRYAPLLAGPRGVIERASCLGRSRDRELISEQNDWAADDVRVLHPHAHPAGPRALRLCFGHRRPSPSTNASRTCILEIRGTLC